MISHRRPSRRWLPLVAALSAVFALAACDTIHIGRYPAPERPDVPKGSVGNYSSHFYGSYNPRLKDF